MKIIKLQAENVKKIKAIEIKPDSNLVQITGANAQGKTSVLDSIWYALGGKDAIDSQPIRDGENEAKIVLEIGELIVTRKFKRSENKTNTSLFVENKDGAKYSSPQTMLDDLVGSLSFDPLAFANLKTKEQFNLLCDLCDIDFDFEDAEKRKTEKYNERTMINRELKEIEAEANNIVVDSDLSTARISIDDALAQLTEAKEHNHLQSRNKSDIMQLQQHNDRIQVQIDDLLDESQKNHDRMEELAKDRQDVKDTGVLEKQLSQAQEINANAEKFERKQLLDSKAKCKKILSDEFTQKLNDIDLDKVKALKNAKMPIDNLSVDFGEVFYNEIPFGQLSGSEKLKISLAIAVAANPNLRVIRITDGSLLDDNAMSELLKFANDTDFQIWIERVEESGKVGVCIEDGSVKERNT